MKKSKSKIVPVLITCDIDPTPEAGIRDKQNALEKTCHLFRKYGIRGTFYIVGKIASDYRKQLRLLLNDGHEIGCHGLTHNEDEEYNRLSEHEAAVYISEATVKIREKTHHAVTSFRGPRVKTSHKTQKALLKLGYTADSSVCSQRLDFISSNLINIRWLLAPRKPYHPHKNNAFRKGKQRLWVIPVSAFIIPFLSATLYIFGNRFMKIFFRFFYYESLLTGKPIVYLLHPSEFSPLKQKVVHTKSMKSIRARGFYFRRILKLRGTINERFIKTETMIADISKYKKVRFMTTKEYVEYIENA